MNQYRANDTLKDTLEACVFRVVVTLANEVTSNDGLSTKRIADDVAQTLVDGGEIREVRELRTRSVTNALKTLGFPLRRGTGNKTFIDTKGFEQVLERNKRRLEHCDPQGS